MAEFVHLHLHSEYSLLDGACRIKDIPEAVSRSSMNAVAITDHGVMYGCVDFYRACKEKGIKPIIGCEVYLCEDRFARVKGYSHLVLLVKNAEGYKNLIKLVSAGFTEGFYTKPRIDKKLLFENCEGLIALSGCIYGEIPKSIIAGDLQSARKSASEMKEAFSGDFYLEMQSHGLPDEITVNDELIAISKELSIPLVATNDVHYLKKSDKDVQAVLNDIKNSSDDDGENPFSRPEFYLKTPEEMSELFRACPEAVENTVKIANECNFDFSFGKTFLPEFPLPEGQTADGYLRKLAEEGLARLLKDGKISEEKREDYKFRMVYELMIIAKMGYSGYYLIVRDFIVYAKRNGITVGPGRGSGAGSLVAYLVEITTIDPLIHGLLFERFLNPERVSMPDFDTDFADDRREDVIKYVKEKYGEDKVCQIAAFGTLAARAAVRDVGRALKMPYPDVDTVAKLIPKDLHITIADAMKKTEKLSALYNSDESVKKLLDIAMAIEGMPRHTTIHAAGVVIATKRLDSIVPLCRSGDAVMTQFDMNTVADLGLLKFDFLALRYLTVIKRTTEIIEKQDPSFRESDIPLDDKETYALISSGDTSGIFQLESGGMRKLLSQMKPNCIDDIMVAISLFRPGPMDSIPRYLECRSNPSKVRYETPELEEILKETYGCIVYQEQVMQICRRLASYSYGRADTVRRLMAKKKTAQMEKERESFVGGCESNQINKNVANEIFDRMAKFAEYAFCKSHAAAYSYTSYKTAYLKTHYKAEYFAALLSSVSGNPKKTAEYITNAQSMDVVCKGPQINISGVSFIASGNTIYYGLSCVKNIGFLFAEKLIEERGRNGSFKNIYDFISRAMLYGANKTQVYSLICAGAFDSFGDTRSSLIASYDEIMASVSDKRHREIDGQTGFFEDSAEDENKSAASIAKLPEMQLFARLSLEKEMTGMYFSGHPIDEYSDAIKKAGAMTPTEFLSRYGESDSDDGDSPDIKDREKVSVCGIVTAVKSKRTKSGDMMAFVSLEDRLSEIETVFFKDAFSRYASFLAVGAAILVEGELSLRDEGDPSVICRSSMLLKDASADGKTKSGEETRESTAEIEKTPVKPNNESGNNKNAAVSSKPNKVFVRVPGENSKKTERIRALSGIFEGNIPLYFYFEDEKKYSKGDIRVNADEFFLHEAGKIAGDENIAVR